MVSLIPVTWALGLLWGLAVGVGVQCCAQVYKPDRRGTASRDGGSGRCSQTGRRQHHPSPEVSKQGSQQVTELLDQTAGRKQSRGSQGLLSICLSACLQGPVLTPQAEHAAATLS